MKLVAGDDPAEAGAVREIDLRNRFYMSATDLAKKCKLTAPKAAAVRRFAGIDADPKCQHTFEHGKSKFPCFSDHAATRMIAAVAEHTIEVIWAARNAVVAPVEAQAAA